MNKDKKFKVYGSGEGKEPEVSVLQSFVPMMDLSEAHLKTAARQSRIITVPQAELIADKFLLNSHYVYLVSGEIANEPVFDIAGEDWSLLPLDSIYGQNDTISAKTDCRVLLIDKAKLDSMLCWDQVAKSLMVELYSERDFDEDREWLQTLLMSNLFHKLPPFNIRDVIDKFDARVVAADEVIVREGETGDECYIIKEGSALVTVFDTVNKNETQVAELEAGQCFGEDALVNRATRNATVRMSENGVLMVLKKRDFLSLMSEPAVFSIPFEQAETAVHKGACWLDVRTQPEFEFDSLPGAFHLPMHLMVLKSRMMDKDKQYFALCGTGRRASTAAYLLQQQGFKIVPVKNGLQARYH